MRFDRCFPAMDKILISRKSSDDLLVTVSGLRQNFIVTCKNNTCGIGIYMYQEHIIL